MFLIPFKSHLSNYKYAVIGGENYYMKADETEVQMPDGYYIIEHETKDKIYIRRNGTIHYGTIKKFEAKESKPQVILMGSVWIYSADGKFRWEIFQENDLFRVRVNGELNTMLKFDKLDMAIKFHTNLKK